MKINSCVRDFPSDDIKTQSLLVNFSHMSITRHMLGVTCRRYGVRPLQKPLIRSYLHVSLMQCQAPSQLRCWSCRRARTTWYGYVAPAAISLEIAANVRYSTDVCEANKLRVNFIKKDELVPRPLKKINHFRFLLFVSFELN